MAAFNAAALVGVSLLALLAPAHAARVSGRGRHGFTALRSDLQPEAVAQTLSRVEQDWRDEAAAFVRCNASTNTSDCAKPGAKFQSSCGTVVDAVMKASSGDRAVVQEYLGEVCEQGSLQGWRSEACQNLASVVLGGMSPIPSSNREGMDMAPLCHKFWTMLAAGETTRLEKEVQEEQAEEKRRAEEQEKLKKEAEEAAKASAEAKKKVQEEAKKQQQAQAEKAAKKAAMQEADTNRTDQLLSSAHDVTARAQDAERSASEDMAEAKAAVAAVERLSSAVSNKSTQVNVTANTTSTNSTLVSESG